MKIECRDILDSIPNADIMTERLLEEYRQLGLLFTFNIDEKPEFCYETKIVSSLVMLEAVSDILLRLEFKGISLNAESKFESEDINELICNLGSLNDDSLAWMSRCVVSAVTTGIRSIRYMCDVSSLLSHKQPSIRTTFKTKPGTSQFTHVARTRASCLLTLLATKTQDMKKLICPTDDELILHITNVVMNVLVGKIQVAFHEKLKPGQKLYQELCALYRSVTSQFTSNLQQFVDCIQDLAQASTQSSQLSDADFETVVLTNVARELMSKSLNGSITSTDVITVIPVIDITSAISKISDLFADNMNTFIPNIPGVGYIEDDGQMLEATNKVLTSVCSDIIRAVVQSRIYHAFMLDLREKAMSSYSFIYEKLPNVVETDYKNTPESKFSDVVSTYSARVVEETRDLRMRSVSSINARLTSEYYNYNIIILDVDREVIATYSKPGKYRTTIQLVFNPPCCEFPGGHYDVYRNGEVVQVTRKKIDEDEDEEEDDDLWFSAVDTATAIDLDFRSFLFGEQHIDNNSIKHPCSGGELLAREHYACQLKHGRALLRLNMNYSTTQIDQPEHVQLHSLLLFSCIKQALKSKNVSQLARVLAKYETKSRSAEERSSGRESEAMTLQVSRDACTLFLSSGRSVEAEVYRQLVVERINDGDITTALMLCCIGHQMVFDRNILYAISSISNLQTIGDNLEHMNKCPLYTRERTTFLLVCDEWYKILEPQGLMTNRERKLLREWIIERDSMLISKIRSYH